MSVKGNGNITSLCSIATIWSLQRWKMKLLIKIFISLAMLTLALRLVDINELKQSLLSIPLPTLAMVVVIFFFGQLLSPINGGSWRAPGASKRPGC